jgi:DNA-binding IclR family transcriptional regulator
MNPLRLQRSIQGQDVSEEYVDLNSSLKAKPALGRRTTLPNKNGPGGKFSMTTSESCATIGVESVFRNRVLSYQTIGVSAMPIIQAVERALCILNLFDEQTAELKISEISERLNLHKSTVHSLLKTLQTHQYIDQNPENGKYRLGLKLLERGQLILQHIDLRTVARKELLRLSEETGQTVHLVILDGKEGVYIDKVEGVKAVIRYSRIGRRVPLHTSAAGKALIAFREEGEIARRMRDYTFRAQTPHTIGNRDDFLRELEQVRSRGYAFDREENEPGVCCAAAPVRDHLGEVAAAVSLSALVSGVREEEWPDLIAGLMRTARRISRALGYRE